MELPFPPAQCRRHQNTESYKLLEGEYNEYNLISMSSALVEIGEVSQTAKISSFFFVVLCFLLPTLGEVRER
jgi:hypothetical protein